MLTSLQGLILSCVISPQLLDQLLMCERLKCVFVFPLQLPELNVCHICVSTCVGECEHPSEGACILVCIINCGQELAYVCMAESVTPGPIGDW